MPRKRTPLVDRFWLRVDRDGPIPHHRPDLGSCWLMLGTASGNGYVPILVQYSPKKSTGAHRVSWEIHFGTIPAGMFVCHRCDNPPCVRPGHLFLGTPAENSADMKSKGRSWQHRGADNRSARLTETAVREIRRLSAEGVSQSELSRRFGVALATVNGIVRRRLWSHIE